MPGIWEEARKRDWEMKLKTNYQAKGVIFLPEAARFSTILV